MKTMHTPLAAFPGKLLQISPMLSLLLISLIPFTAGRAGGQEADFAWRDEAIYRPPDFEGAFPDDPEAGSRLYQALGSLEQGRYADGNPVELFRRGLRRLPVDRQMPALRWFGNAYVWNKSPQDPRAIDLMYHAAGSTNPIIRANAIYFGLSVVRPLTQPILRTLVAIAMNSEDPNVLSRIAWGASAQKEDLLKHLRLHLDSDDPARRGHAEVLRRIFSGELKAFEWAAQKARDAARQKYSDRLEEFRESLTDGDSPARKTTLALIQRERIELIMDETFIDAFRAASGDPDPGVRNAIAVIAGGRWIWGNTNQPSEAINLMMRLARDPDRGVRYNAMYYGLSTLRDRNDDVVERMLEMTFQDGLDNMDFRGRITWGLRNDRETVRRVLNKWMEGNDAIKALLAFGFHLDFIGESPRTNSVLQALLKTPQTSVARLVAFSPTAGSKVQSMDELMRWLREELPASYADHVLWPNNQGPPFVIVENSAISPIEEALMTSSRLKIAGQRTLSVEAIIHIGKTGGLKTLDR
jgi:hypothetical protein